MKKVMIFSSGKATSLLANTLNNFGKNYGLSLYHTAILNNNIPTKKDIKKAFQCDVLAIQGTWGSDLRKFDLSKGKVNPRQSILDHYNGIFAKIAKIRKIPFIVLESSTLSRFRGNYINTEYKNIEPRYYRMAKDHWIYGKATWVSPKEKSRLSDYADQIERYGASIDFNSHSWIKNPFGSILILLGLEHDPTNQNNIESWVLDTIKKLRTITNRKILIKAHPQSKLKFKESLAIEDVYIISSGLKIRDLADHCYCAIIDNSTSIFELTELGIICFTSKDSFGAALGNTDISKIENPYYPTLQEYLDWLHSMSYTEFSIFEFNSESILEPFCELIDS